MGAKFLIIALLLSGTSYAAIIEADTCSSADIQEAIDASADGDTVKVPAGACSWNNGVTIPNTKGIIVKGEGSSETIVNVHDDSFLIRTSLQNKPVRVTGFRFNDINHNSGFLQIIGTAQDWRIDNNIFDDKGNYGAYDIRIGNNDANTESFTYGVIDSNQFINRNYATSIFVEWTRGDIDPLAGGDWIWSQPAQRGTQQAVYIEDNVFSGNGQHSQVVDSRWGAKYVLRYNTIHNPWISTHSACTNNGRDPIWTEVYRNEFTDDNNRYYLPVEMRSTSGIIWDNNAKSPLDVFRIGIDHERSYKSCSGPFGHQCDGGASFDENSGANGYRCLGQPGWGPPQGNDMSTYSFAGLFAWDNFNAGTLVDLHISNNNPYTSQHLQFGRELFNSGDMSKGPISKRPTNCNPGEARDTYISTDENSQGATLYVCSDSDTWTKHWEPFTYPHPLRQETVPDGCANCHYVRKGATGDGSSWENALDTLPDTLQRGHTYYIADGTYSSYTFDDPESGSQWITVKKTTIEDHGTDTGWQDTYGDGYAVWGSIYFDTGYHDFNGAVGGGPGNWKTGHGFRFEMESGNCISTNPIIGSINISHVDFTQAGNHISQNHVSALKSVGTLTGLYFGYNYIHHISGLVLFNRDGSNWLLEYNYAEDVCGMSVDDYTQHCEHMVVHGADDLVVRYNIFLDGRSTGILVNNDGDSRRWKVYGNIFDNDYGSAIMSVAADPADHSNEFIVANNVLMGDNNAKLTMDNSNHKIYNNIIFDTGHAIPMQEDSDYNYYAEVDLIQCNMKFGPNENGQNKYPSACDLLPPAANPFIDSTGRDYRLAVPIQGWPGIDLCSKLSCTAKDTYNIDMLGNVRGADGLWDRGAYEYTGACTPMTITELASIIEQWKDGEININQVMQSINRWKDGC